MSPGVDVCNGVTNPVFCVCKWEMLVLDPMVTETMPLTLLLSRCNLEISNLSTAEPWALGDAPLGEERGAEPPGLLATSPHQQRQRQP